MMVDVPDRVKATPPVYVGPNVTAWYQPANTRRDLPRIPGGQRYGAVDDLMLSSQIQDPVNEAGDDMVQDAQQIAAAEGLVASGSYVSSFKNQPGEIVVINDGTYSNPRVSADVGNTSPHAAAVEFGNRQVGTGHRVLGQVAARYDNPKDEI